MSEVGEEAAEAAPAPEALSGRPSRRCWRRSRRATTTRLVALLEPLHEADVADLLEQLSRPERKALIALWGVELDGSVLSELEEGVRDEIVGELPDDDPRARRCRISRPTTSSISPRTWRRRSRSASCARSTPPTAPRSSSR